MLSLPNLKSSVLGIKNFPKVFLELLEFVSKTLINQFEIFLVVGFFNKRVKCAFLAKFIKQ